MGHHGRGFLRELFGDDEHGGEHGGHARGHGEHGRHDGGHGEHGGHDGGHGEHGGHHDEHGDYYGRYEDTRRYDAGPRDAPPAPRAAPEDAALATLRERFARGEIDRAEYEERYAALQGQPPTWP